MEKVEPEEVTAPGGSSEGIQLLTLQLASRGCGPDGEGSWWAGAGGLGRVVAAEGGARAFPQAPREACPPGSLSPAPRLPAHSPLHACVVGSGFLTARGHRG